MISSNEKCKKCPATAICGLGVCPDSQACVVFYKALAEYASKLRKEPLRIYPEHFKLIKSPALIKVVSQHGDNMDVGFFHGLDGDKVALGTNYIQHITFIDYVDYIEILRGGIQE